MQRRDLIKSLAALPMVLRPIGGMQAASAKIETGKHVMFVSDDAIDLEALHEYTMPDDPLADVLIIVVRLEQHQSVEDVLRIYKLED
jgi:hypothetical protein